MKMEQVPNTLDVEAMDVEMEAALEGDAVEEPIVGQITGWDADIRDLSLQTSAVDGDDGEENVQAIDLVGLSCLFLDSLRKEWLRNRRTYNVLLQPN